MFLTTRGRYAVTAIIDIIIYGKNKPVTLANISERQGISVSYLEQIFLLLKKADVVRSVKGPGGGYIVQKSPDEITLSEILTAVGENIKMTKCQGKEFCNGKKERCVTHHVWESFEQKMSNYLASVTISDIYNSSESKHDKISAS